MRDEVMAALSQLPDSAELEWRSPAQRSFQSRLEEISAHVRDALAVLDAASDELIAYASSIDNSPSGASDIGRTLFHPGSAILGSGSGARGAWADGRR
ncbi:hypothetical protein [Humibacter ginsenosidimutans]|uniref:Uncharacterized protein n=1 Tax=Humibacter ginsenosidimutans TaxID=2599293 RepID=A0A5B8M5F2_9MICO|nr:hypothetical protein [Humibacter ginsenosidimutans]QDZ15421.1 hypothetical protein FPZ11_12230 [Humibacter ginsenosidimutans]